MFYQIIKIYFKTIVIIQVINPNMCNRLIFVNRYMTEVSIDLWGKDKLFNKWARITFYSYGKNKVRLVSYFRSYRKKSIKAKCKNF